jgi:hypothetical protein
MAKPSEKKPVVSKMTLYGSALALVAGVAFYLNSGEAPKAPAKKPAKKAQKAASDGLITDEDYSAHFDPMKAEVRNVFHPLIAVNSQTSLLADMKSGIPTYLTSGESGWTFTGTAEDGKKTMALVENSARGDSAFLTVGETWKTSTVTGINEHHLMLRGPDGEDKEILMESDIQDRLMREQLNRAPVGGSVAPVRPNLNGPIGGAAIAGNVPGGGPGAAGGVPGGLAGQVQAASLDPNGNLSIQADTTAPQPRRGRRRGGFGQ